MTINIIHGDCMDVLKSMPDNSIDSCVTDPPYALNFMGKKWDTGEFAFSVALWREVLRVLKPGGHLLAFGGTRTCHRMTCAIEDAGFEIRDRIRDEQAFNTKYGAFIDGLDREQRGILFELMNDYLDGGSEIAWMYGSGMPKSRSNLKPSYEPIILGRKSASESSISANMQRWGVGSLNIDGCLVPTSAPRPARSTEKSASGLTGHGGAVTYGSYSVRGSVAVGETTKGRWPANTIHDGSDDVVGLYPQSAGQIADARSDGSLKVGNVYGKMKHRGGEASAERRYAENGGTNFAMKPGARRGDNGSASRFFFSGKATKEDRAGSRHPTVKRVSLLQYLARLITPACGTVLDPFAGSGTMATACHREGFNCILIEREAQYVDDIKRRVAALNPREFGRGEVAPKAKIRAARQDGHIASSDLFSLQD